MSSSLCGFGLVLVSRFFVFLSPFVHASPTVSFAELVSSSGFLSFLSVFEASLAFFVSSLSRFSFPVSLSSSPFSLSLLHQLPCLTLLHLVAQILVIPKRASASFGKRLGGRENEEDGRTRVMRRRRWQESKYSRAQYWEEDNMFLLIFASEDRLSS